MINAPAHIDEKHWEELIIGSGIDPELAALNVVSLSRNSAYDYLLYSDKLDRLNSGRLSQYWMTRYGHLDFGGWWCNGVDLTNGSDSLWGCLKPNKPRSDNSSNKVKDIKYEHPPKINTECWFLRVSARIWELI
ncbi:MAG: DNA primase, partial [Sphaerospermopsis kisseleviana]